MVQLRSALGKQPSETISSPPASKETKRSVLKEKTNTMRGKKSQSALAAKPEKAVVKKARTQVKKPSNKPSSTEDISVVERILKNARKAPKDGEEEVSEDTIEVKDRSSRRASRQPSRPAKEATQPTVLEGMKERMDATARRLVQSPKKAQIATDEIASSSGTPPVLRAATPQQSGIVTEFTELSLSPSPPAGRYSSANAKRTSYLPPGSAIRVHGTPAHEMSLLALKNFRRRPRQPSMLQMIQNRTTSARPSLANSQANEDSSVFDLGADEDEEDFLPEAEGTPLQVSNVERGSSPHLKDHGVLLRQNAGKDASPIANKKRKSDAVEQVEELPGRTKRSRRSRISGDDDVSSIQVRPVSKGLMQRPATGDPSATDIQVLGSEPSSTPPTRASSGERRTSSTHADFVVPSTEPQDALERIHNTADDEDICNATFADPVSSPLPSLSLPPSGTQMTDIYADPLTQRSPPPRKRTTRNAQKPAEALQTDVLKALLPRRRRRLATHNRKSDYDIDSDAESDSLDLTIPEDDIRITTQSKSNTRLARSKRSGATPAKQKRSSGDVKTSGRKIASKKPTRVYGRKSATSDKENEENAPSSMIRRGDNISALPDTSTATQVSRSKELDEIRRKFAEVDEWDLSFEAITPEDHRSSSQGWR